MINGIGVSEGIGIGNAFILKKAELNIDSSKICDTNAEVDSFEKAIEISKVQIGQLYSNALKTLGESEAQIFKSHEMILFDEALLGEVKSLINSKNCRAPFAVQQVSNQLVELFENMENEYMRERAADIKDVSTRIYHYARTPWLLRSKSRGMPNVISLLCSTY